MDEIIISIFYDIDNFCKELKKYFEHFRYRSNYNFVVNLVAGLVVYSF